MPSRVRVERTFGGKVLLVAGAELALASCVGVGWVTPMRGIGRRIGLSWRFLGCVGWRVPV